MPLCLHHLISHPSPSHTCVSDLLRCTQLDLSNNGIGPEGAKPLADALRVSPSVTECNLRDNKLGVEGWTIVFNALRDSTTSKIVTWNLSSEGLGPEIAKPLAEYISVTASLTSLNLADNILCGVNAFGRGTYSAEGIKAIADALRVCASVTEVR